jgi:hypothetical protein
LTDMFSIVTKSQLALDGNYDRVCCLKHVGTEGRTGDDAGGAIYSSTPETSSLKAIATQRSAAYFPRVRMGGGS